jgi:hypothetical protein
MILKRIPPQPEPQNQYNFTEKRPARFVVIRDGYRVSAEEYETPTDPRAISEAEFWDRVATRHSWGEKVDIVEYDNKYHRVY